MSSRDQTNFSDRKFLLRFFLNFPFGAQIMFSFEIFSRFSKVQLIIEGLDLSIKKIINILFLQQQILLLNLIKRRQSTKLKTNVRMHFWTYLFYGTRKRLLMINCCCLLVILWVSKKLMQEKHWFYWRELDILILEL